MVQFSKFCGSHEDLVSVVLSKNIDDEGHYEYFELQGMVDGEMEI